MDKNEYVTKRDELQTQLAFLKDEYIKTNSPFPIGTKVKITHGNGDVEYGFIERYECHWDDVQPIVKKIKKDGTPHATAHIYIGWRSKIETA